MKIDLEQTFVDEHGKPIVKFVTVEGTEEKKEVKITLKDLLKAAVNSFDPQAKPTPEEKYERYQIIKALNETSDLTIAQLSTVRKAVGEHGFLPFVHGQVIDMIDQKETGLKVMEGGKK